jgi:quinone-modifying oxidoreductase subunit QmoC
MSDQYLIEPDVNFINDINKLGGQDVKKCFQCATCSVACPISPDTKPFPRKEMIATSWGLKDRLIGNGDIWLCHNCGDCTSLCPRGAKPGDVLAAVRSFAIAEYASPKFLGKAINNPAMLPILLAIPAIIFLVLGFILKAFGVDWLNFNPEHANLWQNDYIANYLVDVIMIPTSIWVVAIFALGLKRFLADMHANALLEGKTDKQSIEPLGFITALIKTIPTILVHQRFNECTENKERSTAHMMVLFAFIGLFFVTACFFIAEWVLHIEGPYPQIVPIKWVANLGGIALIIGAGLLIGQRMKNQDQLSVYKDWYLLWLVMGLGVTGLLTQFLRLVSAFDAMAVIYAIHLILVWSLFAYLPFSKLAHLVYRTVAMTYQTYSGRQ